MSLETPRINLNYNESDNSSSSGPKLSLPSLHDATSPVSSPNAIDNVLNQFGYRYLGKITDTIQGELILAETVISEHHKAVRQVAIKRTSKDLYANKIMREDDGTNFVLDEDILQESLLLYKSTITNKCPGGYLCQFIECFHSETDYYLAMEYISSRTTLREFVQKGHQYIMQGMLEKKEWVRIVKFITWQLVVTLHYLHNTMNIAHLDLSMDNIMVRGGEFVLKDNQIKIERSVNIKIIDFGLATSVEQEDDCCIVQHPAFSLTEKCPQIFNDEVYSAKKADIWSLGLIIFQMMFNCIPYKKQTDTDSRYGWLARGKLVEVLRRENPSTMPVTVKLVAFLKDTLAFNEKKRANIADVLRHGYLQSYYQRYKADFERMTSPKNKVEDKEQESRGKKSKDSRTE